MKEFHEMIKQICKEKNITFSILSKDWIMMLEKENKTKFISGYKFDLNSHGFGNIIDDKYATYEIFKQKKISIIDHRILFNEKNKEEYAKDSNNYQSINNFFNSHNQNIVLKANSGTCGNEVYHITNTDELSFYLKKLFIKHFSISICPFYKIKTEYRLIVLNNKCLLMYGKKRPVVIGDGKKSISQLLKEFNPYYFEDRLIEEEYKKVLKFNEVYEYGWQFNLSKGAIPYTIKDEKIKEQLLNLLKEITSTVHLGFCSLDIIETNNNEFYVMEINSGVMMKNYMQIISGGKEIAKQIYSKAIDEMFKNKE